MTPSSSMDLPPSQCSLDSCPSAKGKSCRGVTQTFQTCVQVAFPKTPSCQGFVSQATWVTLSSRSCFQLFSVDLDWPSCRVRCPYTQYRHLISMSDASLTCLTRENDVAQSYSDKKQSDSTRMQRNPGPAQCAQDQSGAGHVDRNAPGGCTWEALKRLVRPGKNHEMSRTVKNSREENMAAEHGRARPRHSR